MISIVLSKSVDKSNTKYYDVVIKWLNVVTLTVHIDKIHTKSYFLVLDNNKLTKCYYINIKYW